MVKTAGDRDAGLAALSSHLKSLVLLLPHYSPGPGPKSEAHVREAGPEQCIIPVLVLGAVSCEALLSV